MVKAIMLHFREYIKLNRHSTRALRRVSTSTTPTYFILYTYFTSDYNVFVHKPLDIYTLFWVRVLVEVCTLQNFFPLRQHRGSYSDSKQVF